MPNPNETHYRPEARAVLDKMVSSPGPEPEYYDDPRKAPLDVPLVQDPVTGKFMKAVPPPEPLSGRGYAEVGNSGSRPKNKGIVSLDVYEYPAVKPNTAQPNAVPTAQPTLSPGPKGKV